MGLVVFSITRMIFVNQKDLGQKATYWLTTNSKIVNTNTMTQQEVSCVQRDTTRLHNRGASSNL